MMILRTDSAASSCHIVTQVGIVLWFVHQQVSSLTSSHVEQSDIFLQHQFGQLFVVSVVSYPSVDFPWFLVSPVSSAFYVSFKWAAPVGQRRKLEVDGLSFVVKLLPLCLYKN